MTLCQVTTKQIPKETKICSPEVQVSELALCPPCCPKALELHLFTVTAVKAALDLHIPHHFSLPWWWEQGPPWHPSSLAPLSTPSTHSWYLLDCLCPAVLSVQQIVEWLKYPMSKRTYKGEAAPLFLHRSHLISFLCWPPNIISPDSALPLILTLKLSVSAFFILSWNTLFSSTIKWLMIKTSIMFKSPLYKKHWDSSIRIQNKLRVICFIYSRVKYSMWIHSEFHRFCVKGKWPQVFLLLYQNKYN